MIQFRRALLSLLVLSFFTLTHAQKPTEYSSVDLFNKVEKLNVLGTVLYFAAHPDDENTRLISYFANDRKVRTAYLSLTRGDGGQNLIGTQIWEKLGLIRTNELLKARSVDGGTQFFSRANDFGYSKHPDETLAFWNKDEVMHDIIKIIREFRPDVIVNRFDHRTPGRTHGHHTSSAMLSVEAFDLAGDPTFLTERLPNLEPWQPARVFFNTSWWFYGSRQKFNDADKTNLFAADAGVYYPMRGVSNTEIAARSRSMHKSQGFGSTGTRGSEMEYGELVKGSRPSDKEDMLSGLDFSWNRVKGGQPIEQKVNELLSNYDFADPSANIPQLVNIYDMVEQIDDQHWRKIKLAEIEEILIASAGLYLEVRSEYPHAVRGDSVNLIVEAINRSNATIHLRDIVVSGQTNSFLAQSELTTSALKPNERFTTESKITISSNKAYSNPYWLDKKGTMGMYHVEEESLIGQPMPAAAYTATFHLDIAGKAMTVSRDIIFKRNDPVDGEVVSPFYIKPRASVSFTDPVYIFPDDRAKSVSVIVKANRDNVNGQLSLNHPTNWKISPSSVDIQIERNGEERIYEFMVTGPAKSESASMSVSLVTDDGIMLNKAVTEIDFDHIPSQIIVSASNSKFERLSLETRGRKIAYLQGAGDAIPKSLRQIGYDVTEIELDDITKGYLENFDALVMGVRAYNTKKELLLKRDAIMNYMNEGGTVIVQYNTSRRIKGDDIGPYSMELSRDRVTDELAEITFEEKDHEILNFPNKITSVDFKDWVQERGLYFPNKWDAKYSAPLSCHDKGEPSRQGGLLVAPVGEGHFIYTGYSWFRQLPAGVGGAFRIFANMLSIGKNKSSMSQKNSGGN